MKIIGFNYILNGQKVYGEFEYSGPRMPALLSLVRFRNALPASARFSIFTPAGR